MEILSMTPTRFRDRMQVAQDRERLAGDLGYSMVELLVVCLIIGIVSIIALPAYNATVNIAKKYRASTEIRSIEKAIIAFNIERGNPPASLSDVHMTIKDPWGNDYQYSPTHSYRDRFSNLVNPDSFDLYSKGKDMTTTLQCGDGNDDIIRAGDGGDVVIAEKW